MNPIIKFEQGSLVLENFKNPSEIIDNELVQFDERTLQYRAYANIYRDLILQCKKMNIRIDDQAKAYQCLENLKLKQAIEPRVHQEKALKAWLEAKKKGVVSLPTGAGKTILAVLAISIIKRSTLIIVPTIDLLQQWHSVLRNFLDIPIGCLGGGEKDIQSITVSTYDSARLCIEQLGNKFAFLIADECHHLPAPQYQLIAKACIAPFRLALSATVERSDGQESVVYELMGEKIYHGHIREMVSKVLSL